MITVTLTQEEVKARSFSLAQVSNQLVELEEEEDDVKADYKTKMADIKERRLKVSDELRRLSRAVRLGVEERSEQQVLFEEEKRLEEFRQQQQSKEAVGDFFGGNEEAREWNEAAGEFIAEIDAEEEAQRQAGEDYEEGEGFNPGFPPGSGPDRASAGLAQADEDGGGNYQAEWLAGLNAEERDRYFGAPCSCPHSRDWHGVDGNEECGACECEKFHCRVCDTKGGHQATCKYYVLGEGTPVQKADDFTAKRCDKCGRIDGAHTPECVWSDALTFDDYLAFATAHYGRNRQSYARKLELTKRMDDEIRAWKAEQQQAGNGAEPEPEKRPKKRKKLPPVEAAIDR